MSAKNTRRKRTTSKIIEIIFPALCVWCEKETLWVYLCSDCKKEMIPHPEQCVLCHKASPNYSLCYTCKEHAPLEWVLICFQYTSHIKKLILWLKFSHRYDIAPFLAQRLSLLIQTHPPLSKAMRSSSLIITSVPSHRRRRYFVKGYNQSELLAKHLARFLEIPFFKLTKRVKHTRSQTSLWRKQRLTNLIGAFSNMSSQASDLKEKTILIVDDITTTWSTLMHVATQIKKDNPTCSVWGWVLGRHGT